MIKVIKLLMLGSLLIGSAWVQPQTYTPPPMYPMPYPSPEPPGTPSIRPTVLSCDSNFSLSWQISPDGDLYQVQEKRRSVGHSWPTSWSPPWEQSSNVFWPDNLVGATEYLYRVRAVRQTGSGDDEYSIWVQSLPIVRPAFESIEQTRSDFKWSDYKIYYGDFDNDGIATDIYLWGADKFVLIHSDISIPLTLRGPVSFKLLQKHDGSYIKVATDKLCRGERVRESSGEQLRYRALTGEITELKADSGYAAGDFNGDGYDEVILLNRNHGEDSAIIKWTSGGEPVVIGSLALGAYSDRLRLDIGDVNGDGREDIKLYSGGMFIRVLIADSQGRFSLDSDDPKTKAAEIELSIRQVWQDFTGAIASGDIEKASQFTLGAYGEKLKATAEVLGGQLAEVLDQVEEIEPYYMSDELAIFLLRKQADNGEMYLHTMTLVPQSDGSWRIKEL